MILPPYIQYSRLWSTIYGVDNWREPPVLLGEAERALRKAAEAQRELFELLKRRPQ